MQKKITDQGCPSAQKAELLAMIKALQLGEGQRVEIHTDSQYVFNLMAMELAKMSRTQWRTSSGTPVMLTWSNCWQKK